MRGREPMNFRDQSEHWLSEQQTREIRPSSLRSYRSILRTHLWPRFGDQSLDDLAKQNNRMLRILVEELRTKYAPASISLILGVTKQILESECDDNGLPVRSLVWATDYINAPPVVPSQQKAPVVSAEQVRAACSDPRDGDLYQLLAASGLRISEALALVREDVSDGVVHVRQGKTVNAARYVDLAPAIAETMARLAGDTKPGTRIFRTHLTTLRERIKVPGFHSLRRFRESVLQRSECRALLINAWMGHRDPEMASRYGRQLLEDNAYRRDWAARVGTGFEIPSLLYHRAEPQITEHGILG